MFLKLAFVRLLDCRFNAHRTAEVDGGVFATGSAVNKKQYDYLVRAIQVRSGSQQKRRMFID